MLSIFQAARVVANLAWVIVGHDVIVKCCHRDMPKSLGANGNVGASGRRHSSTDWNSQQRANCCSRALGRGLGGKRTVEAAWHRNLYDV
jgi:hypothetical protein